MNGTLNHGRVKRTPNQRKKHVTQLTNDEWAALITLTARLQPSAFCFSNHLSQKAEFSCSLQDCQSLLFDYPLTETLVEFNATKRQTLEARLLLRSPDERLVHLRSRDGETVEQMAQLCAVFSLSTMEVVTAYWNLSGDDHRSLDWSRYDKALSVMEALQRAKLIE